MRVSVLLPAACLVAACQTSPDREAETSEAASGLCPPVPPSNPNIIIDRVTPTTLGAGQMVTIEGRNFDLLPRGTVAWFYSDANAFTATSELIVDHAGRARAVVPSHHLILGKGKVSLYHTECVDCSSQGGSTNACQGNWVNTQTNMPIVQFTHPAPKPLPASEVSAIATSPFEVQLAWRDNSADEDHFDLLMGPDPRSTLQLLGPVPRDRTSEPVTNLRPDTNYCFEVRSVNSSGFDPVPPEAKACARTPPVRADIGTIVIRDVSGFGNTLCAATLNGVVLRAFTDSNQDGRVNALRADHVLDDPAPAWVEPDVLHEPPWHIYVANEYATGANMFVYAQFEGCGPGDPQFAGLHLRWTGGSHVAPVFLVAGNWWENTGPTLERQGVVMITDELTGSPTFDSTTGRVSGSVHGVVRFRVEILSTGVAFESRAEVTFDFSGGVEVIRE